MAVRTAERTEMAGREGPRRRSLTVPGLLLGLGLGGFVDGILLHQILGWHHMRSGDGAGGGEPITTVGGLEANTLADGLSHTGTWILVLVGVAMIWDRSRDGDASWRRLAGLLLAGWGLFNLVEGVIDHQILGIHHVRDDEGAPLGWDLAFLASGVVLIAVGALLARGRRPAR
jgi:uncharacterized membrane protein